MLRSRNIRKEAYSSRSKHSDRFSAYPRWDRLKLFHNVSRYRRCVYSTLRCGCAYGSCAKRYRAVHGYGGKHGRACSDRLYIAGTCDRLCDVSVPTLRRGKERKHGACQCRGIRYGMPDGQSHCIQTARRCAVPVCMCIAFKRHIVRYCCIGCGEKT